MAENNKSQMHQAMGNLNQFGRTEYAAKNRKGFYTKEQSLQLQVFEAYANGNIPNG